MAIPEYIPSAADQYHQRSFGVVLLGLSWAQEQGSTGHLEAHELVEAIANMAEKRWGLMAPVVLDHLDMGSSKAIGKIVEEMINLSLVRRSPTDRLEDFDEGPDLAKRFAIESYPWCVSPEAVHTTKDSF